VITKKVFSSFGTHSVSVGIEPRRDDSKKRVLRIIDADGGGEHEIFIDLEDAQAFIDECQGLLDKQGDK
jgi:hypothetical protein